MLTVVAFLVLGALNSGSYTVAVAFSQSESIAMSVAFLDTCQTYLTNSSLDTSATMLVSDLLRLVPQQLLPFEKVDPARWYVLTSYPTYAAAGGSFAFGILVETALSRGGVAALFRGLAMGSTLGGAPNLLIRCRGLWTYLIYIWLITSIYQSFGDATFALVGRFVLQLASALALCAAVTLLVRNSAGRHVSRIDAPSLL